MRSATLVSWLVTASLGAFMLRTWLARGGLHSERAKIGGLPPQLIFGHAGAAITGLLVWVAFLASGARPLAWVAVTLLIGVVGLGVSTVTLWTPYPARKPGERRRLTAPDEPLANQSAGNRATGEQAAGDQAAGEQAAGSMSAEFEVTDEMIARFLADPVPAPGSRPIRPDPAALVPIAHGFAAIATFALAVMSAIE